MSGPRVLALFLLLLTSCAWPAASAAGDVLVPLSSLAAPGRIRTQWEAKTQLITLATATTRVELHPGSRELLVRSLTTRATRRETLALAPTLDRGQPLVPERAVRAALGVPAAPALAKEDHPNPRAAGAIVGEVQYHGEPLGGVVLRLVRAADGRFLRERRAVSDGAGRYQFSGVPVGRYRVYAYTGDNAAYFNRETPTLEVRHSPVKAEPLRLGRMLLPQAPPPGAKGPRGALTLRWTPCPGASEYAVTLLEAEGGREVLRGQTHAPELTLAEGTLAAGRRYQVRVLATGRDGAFLGATAGKGRAPWEFATEEEASTAHGRGSRESRE